MDEAALERLSSDWYQLVVSSGVDLERPGLYEWRIDHRASYIGQCGSFRRPQCDYTRNLRRLFRGLPYRQSNPDGYRRVHRELAKAVRDSAPIWLVCLENVDDRQLRNRREREVIAERLDAMDLGGQIVLNDLPREERSSQAETADFRIQYCWRCGIDARS